MLKTVNKSLLPRKMDTLVNKLSENELYVGLELSIKTISARHVHVICVAYAMRYGHDRRRMWGRKHLHSAV